MQSEEGEAFIWLSKTSEKLQSYLCVCTLCLQITSNTFLDASNESVSVIREAVLQEFTAVGSGCLALETLPLKTPPNANVHAAIKSLLEADT